MTRKWAPDNDSGLHAYVVTPLTWSPTERIEYATSLADARRRYGYGGPWSGVRRARSEDMVNPSIEQVTS